MYQIEKTTLIAEIMENAPFVAPMFQAIGMHCMAAPWRAARTSRKPALRTASMSISLSRRSTSLSRLRAEIQRSKSGEGI